MYRRQCVLALNMHTKLQIQRTGMTTVHVRKNNFVYDYDPFLFSFEAIRCYLQYVQIFICNHFSLARNIYLFFSKSCYKLYKLRQIIQIYYSLI